MEKLTLDIGVMLSLGITPNQYLFLQLVKEKDKQTIAKVTEIYRLTDDEIATLVAKGLLINNNRQGERLFSRFEITEAFGEAERAGETLQELAEKMLKLYPTETGGRVLAADTREMARLLKEFFETYPYTSLDVLAATALYIEKQNKNDFGRYTLSPTNFIYKKGTGSTLASYCQLIKQGESSLGDWTTTDF